MILYYSYSNETKKHFVCPNLKDGIIKWPYSYDFVYLLKVHLTSDQIGQMDLYGWVEYDILHK